MGRGTTPPRRDAAADRQQSAAAAAAAAAAAGGGGGGGGDDCDGGGGGSGSGSGSVEGGNTGSGGRRQRMESLLKKKQRRLGNLLNLVLVQSYDCAADDGDRLRYYQGYHDVGCIFLSALGGSTIVAGAPGNSIGELGSGSCSGRASSSTATASHVDQAALAASAMGLDVPSSVLLQVSRSHFRDSMRPNFKSLSAALRLIVMPLLAALDPEVHDKLHGVGMEPFFAISWIITWFSHDVRDTDLVKRLFDVFLVSHPLMPVYMSVAMVLHPINRMEILQAESEFSAVHTALTHLPRNSCSVGWRYQGGVDGGYVSDEGEDDDETTLGSTVATQDQGYFFSDDMSTIGASDASVVEQDISSTRGDCDDDNTSVATSVASTSLLSSVRGSPRVPFEDLIDMSLSFMRRIPPRKLVPLAKRYFSRDVVRPLLADTSSIAFLQRPPAWALAPTAPSDLVLKRKALLRKMLVTDGAELSPGKKKKIQTKTPITPIKMAADSDASPPSNSETSSELAPRMDEKAGYIKLKAQDGKKVRNVQAVIASGMGPDGNEEVRLRKRRRRRIIRISVTVAVISVAVALVHSGAVSVPFLRSPLGTARPSNLVSEATAPSQARLKQYAALLGNGNDPGRSAESSEKAGPTTNKKLSPSPKGSGSQEVLNSKSGSGQCTAKNTVKESNKPAAGGTVISSSALKEPQTDGGGSLPQRLQHVYIMGQRLQHVYIRGVRRLVQALLGGLRRLIKMGTDHFIASNEVH